MKEPSESLAAHPKPQRRLFWRLMAAVPLNYAYTSTVTVFAARQLPMDPAQASVAANMMSFLVFAVLALVAFSVHSIARLWIFLLASGAMMALMAWTSILAEGRG